MKPFTREAATSQQGYHVRCDGPDCNSLAWYDTTHGFHPSPVFCGQDCYDDWCDAQPPNCTPPA